MQVPDEGPCNEHSEVDSRLFFQVDVEFKHRSFMTSAAYTTTQWGILMTRRVEIIRACLKGYLRNAQTLHFHHFTHIMLLKLDED